MQKGEKTKYFLNEMYQIYQQGIHLEILFEDGYLSPWTFKNVVRIGLRLEKYDASENFVKTNLSKLKEPFISDAYHFNMADICYYKGDLEKGLEYLIQVEFSDIYYIIGTKNLMLKIYFETGAEEALFSLIASFRIYLKRNNIIPENTEVGYQNFITILEKIAKGIPSEKILKEINNHAALVDKKWLLSKLFYQLF